MLEIEGLLVRASMKALCCVLEQVHPLFTLKYPDMSDRLLTNNFICCMEIASSLAPFDVYDDARLMKAIQRSQSSH